MTSFCTVLYYFHTETYYFDKNIDNRAASPWNVYYINMSPTPSVNIVSLFPLPLSGVNYEPHHPFSYAKKIEKDLVYLDTYSIDG